MSTALNRTLDTVRPITRDGDYYVRLVTGLMAMACFFAVAAFVAQREYQDFEGLVRREGNTSFFNDRDDIAGSKGQAIVAGIVAASCLVAAVATAVRRFEMGVFAGIKAFALITICMAILFGFFVGFIVNGALQMLLLGNLDLRLLFWPLLPLLFAATLYGALYYAAEAEGSLLDL